jgi:hypothetical protein
MEIKEFLEKEFIDIKINKEENEIEFITKEYKYKMYHDQDCCENVYIAEIIGDINDLIRAPIIKASEDCSSDCNPEEIKHLDQPYDFSWSWTFYNLATKKGHVTIRWCGESNGYYSESVDITREKYESNT